MTDLIQPIDIVLRAIREERSFRSDFSKAADSIVDKVYSFYTNPNCTCKATIIDWIGKNTDAVNTLLTTHTEKISLLVADITKAAEIAASAKKENVPPQTHPRDPAAILKNPNSKFGSVIDIERDPDAYKELIHKAIKEGWSYRGCTVVPDIVDGKAVWSVFFY